MSLFKKIFLKMADFKSFKQYVYPFLIIILVPVLLIISTVWNLRAFNRDANFLVRHEAISVAETIKPFLSDALDSSERLKNLVVSVDQANEDVLLISLLKQNDNHFDVLASSGSEQQTEDQKNFQLNGFAAGLKEPFAGLSYDPLYRRNVWNVVVPLNLDTDRSLLLAVKLDTKSVTEILDRTTKDSIIVLSILVIISLALLANHFYYLTRSLKVQQLEELDKLKDEFLSMAAHELRAPITALVGYLQLLTDKLNPDEVTKVSEDLKVLDSLTKDLNNLINDLLDVSRIEQGRLKLEVKDVQLNEVISNCIKNFTPLSTQKGLKIIFTQSNLPVIKTDPDRVRQVITNIVSNSIKYTIKGEITITAVLKDKFIEVTVKDSGIGIPQEELTKLFTKFHRVKDKQTFEVRGTGLGLWITKEIVEALGGKIYAQSIYGSGSSFIFTIPA